MKSVGAPPNLTCNCSEVEESILMSIQSSKLKNTLFLTNPLLSKPSIIMKFLCNLPSSISLIAERSFYFLASGLMKALRAFLDMRVVALIVLNLLTEESRSPFIIDFRGSIVLIFSCLKLEVMADEADIMFLDY